VKDPAELTLTQVASAIRSGKLASIELTHWTIERISHWKALNAFVRLEPEEALAAAKAADRTLKRRGPTGPLHGVPLAHKDMYYYAGKPAGCGSKIREGWIAPTTSTVIARLQQAGAFRLGALHMAEFAYGPTGHNAHLGPARNPWGLDRITGGSSSGSGAAVAARLVHAALGSDTGGSIRLPAHFCGITGLKTTAGRVSRARALPLSFSLDTVGPLAQTAEDCGLIASIISGPDPLDPTTATAPAWNAKAAKRSPKEMTIGVPANFYLDDLEKEVATTFEGALITLRRMGAKVVQVKLPDQGLLSAAALVVLQAEAASFHAPWLRTRPQDYGPQVRNRLENGVAYSALDYLEALRWRGPALAAHLEAIGSVDVILAPVSRAAAPTIESTDFGGAAAAERAIQAITRLMRPVNYLGLPALVAPAGQSSDGLPIGLQLIGRPFGDETVVALGSAFQKATDHHRRIPQLA
jgi:aspartyl-tRNA(Asn)/glutamyl-tRNA(Gln) amidotransferase subunit A